MVQVVRSRQVWDVRVPPPKKKMVGGKLVPFAPTLGIARGFQRRLCIEVRGEDDSIPDEKVNSAWKLPTSKTLTAKQQQDQQEKLKLLLPKPPSDQLPHTLEDFESEDYVLIRMLRPRRTRGLRKDKDVQDKTALGKDDHADEGDVMEDAGHEDSPSAENNAVVTAMEEEGFIENRKFDMDGFIERENPNLIPVHQKTTIEVTIGRVPNLEVYDVHFAHEDEMKEALSTLRRLRYLQKERAKKRLHEFRQQNKKPKQSFLTTSVMSSSRAQAELASEVTDSIGEVDEAIPALLIEIVSALNLPVADLTSSDPYVEVWLGRTKLHRTSTIMNTLDPVYTMSQGSLFLFSPTAIQFFEATHGLIFKVKDYDAVSVGGVVGADDDLGQVALSQRTLLNLKGQRIEYDLEQMSEKKMKMSVSYVNRPRLVLRVRRATEQDIAFVKTMKKIQNMMGSNKKFGVYAKEAYLSPSHGLGTELPLKRQSKKVKETGETLHRVKPFPDPDRPEETKWMTKEKIEEEHLKPSTKWVETGSGGAGRLYLEVLRCDGLPNMDAGMGLGKTDTFCAIIFEDAIVNTNVIYDELSPRWMPWSQRAFCFHIEHPSSQVHLGVFDYDKLNKNDPIGRISIDTSNLNANMEYTMAFTIYSSVLDDIRPPVGTVTVRLRLDLQSFRNEVLATVKSLAPEEYINVTTKGRFDTARFVTSGEENLNNLDMDAIQSYANELQGYVEVLYYLERSIKTLLLWRGHFPIEYQGETYQLPLHSMIAFTMGVLLVENFERFPAFFLFSIAWFMLATNEERNRNPDPWHQCASFSQMALSLILDGPKAKRDMRINDDLRERIKSYEATKEKAKQRQLRRIEMTKRAMRGDITDYVGEEDSDNEQVKVETDTGGFQMNVLKPVLLPIQKGLGHACVYLRVTKSVIVWDEPVYAFVITLLSILGGFQALFLPWTFIVRNSLRVAVWAFLGPWMKLVDIHLVQQFESEDDDNYVIQVLQWMQHHSRLLLFRDRTLMTYKESVLKTRAMKRYMFGKFIVRVPQFKEFRYTDVPLSELSTAVPYSRDAPPVVISDHKHGQRLTGDMVPHWGDDDDDGLKTAKARAGQGALRRVNPLEIFHREGASIVEPDDDIANAVGKTRNAVSKGTKPIEDVLNVVNPLRFLDKMKKNRNKDKDQ